MPGNRPLPTPELLILIALLESIRVLYGEEGCRTLIGRMYDSLARSFPANVLEINADRTPEIVAYMAAQREAADLLMRLGEACGVILPLMP